jgi:hypothetical protein
MTFEKFCKAVGLTGLVAFELAYLFVKLVDDDNGKAKPANCCDNHAAAVPAVCPHCGCSLGKNRE